MSEATIYGWLKQEKIDLGEVEGKSTDQALELAAQAERDRGLKPLVAEAGAPWAGFHTFRHTFASLHLVQGTNLLQLSRASATTRPPSR